MKTAEVIRLADVRKQLELARAYELRAAHEDDGDAELLRGMAQVFRRKALAGAVRHTNGGGALPGSHPNWWS